MGEHKPLFCKNRDLHVESVRHFISSILFPALQPVSFRQSVVIFSGTEGRMQRQQLHAVIEIKRDQGVVVGLGSAYGEHSGMCGHSSIYVYGTKGLSYHQKTLT